MKVKQACIKKIMSLITIWTLIALLLSSCKPVDTSLIYSPFITDSIIQKNGLDTHINNFYNTIHYLDKNANDFIYYSAYPLFNTMNNKEVKYIEMAIEDITPEYKVIYKNYPYMQTIYNGLVFYPTSLSDDPIVVKNQEGEKLEIDLSDLSDADSFKLETKMRKNEAGKRTKVLVYTNQKNGMIISLFPAITGFEIEFAIQNATEGALSFMLKTAKDMVRNTNFYSAFGNKAKDHDISYIVQERGARLSDGTYNHLHLSTQEEEKNLYGVKLQIPENGKDVYPLKTSLSIELYADKALIDSQVFSGYSNKNAYLKSYAVLGSDDIWGTQRSFIRFSTSNLPEIRPENIISVDLVMKMIEGPSDARISAFFLEKEWCSWTLNWDTMPGELEIFDESEVDKDGYFHIDITSLFKENLVKDVEQLTEVGVGIKASNEDDYMEVATADNCTYPIYYTIVYKNE